MSRASLSGAPDLFAPSTHRFLSAHYDDIALSCGGTVALLARSGARPEIRVAFGAEPDFDLPLSAFAGEQHRRWGLDAGQVIRVRRAEEATAAALLGATSSCLSQCDAIYRGDWYHSDDQLFGPVAADEAALPSQLARELQEAGDAPASTRYYAPLGVGNHVDHQLCFAAGLELAANGWEVWFYEDLPYGLQPGALDRRLSQIAASWRMAPLPAVPPGGRLEPAARIEIGAVWNIKLASILAYASQVPTIFREAAPDGSVARIEAALRDYALRAGNGLLTEQMWRFAGTGAATRTP